MPTPLLVLLNRDAGAVAREPEDRVAAVRREFAQQGCTAEVRALPARELLAAVRAAVPARPAAIVVGGGDGTLSAVAGLLADSPTALGILPLGTLNHFAVDAGVPRDWTAAVAVAARGTPRPVDVGEVNGRIFLNTCSLGGYVTALRRREVLRRRASHGKARAMFWGLLAALRRVPRLHVEVATARQRHRLRVSFVLVANNRYQDDVLVSGRRERLDRGRLAAYASRAHRYRDLLWTLLALWRRGLHQTIQLEFWEDAELVLQVRERPLRAAIDGELAELDSPLRLRSRPGALRVLAIPDR